MIDPRSELLGWATDTLVDLDAMAPGLIRRVLTAPPMVRQAVFSVLADRVSRRTLGRAPDESEV